MAPLFAASPLSAYGTTTPLGMGPLGVMVPPFGAPSFFAHPLAAAAAAAAAAGNGNPYVPMPAAMAARFFGFSGTAIPVMAPATPAPHAMSMNDTGGASPTQAESLPLAGQRLTAGGSLQTSQRQAQPPSLPMPTPPPTALSTPPAAASVGHRRV